MTSSVDKGDGSFRDHDQAVSGAVPSRFTVVFEGDIGAFPGNPFHVQTPFGRPWAVGKGDLMDQRDDLLEALRRGLEAREREAAASLKYARMLDNQSAYSSEEIHGQADCAVTCAAEASEADDLARAAIAKATGLPGAADAAQRTTTNPNPQQKDKDDG